MGAEYLQHRYPYLSKNELVAEYKKLINAASTEEYSGDWGETTGIVFFNTVCKTEQDAEELLGKEVEKWGPALAVQYRPLTVDAAFLGNLIEEHNRLVASEAALRTPMNIITVQYIDEKVNGKRKKQGAERSYYHCIHCDILYPITRKTEICSRCRRCLVSQEQQEAIELYAARIEESKKRCMDLGAESQGNKLHLPRSTHKEGGWVLAALVSV
jgi:hypothetical protein